MSQVPIVIEAIEHIRRLTLSTKYEFLMRVVGEKYSVRLKYYRHLTLLISAFCNSMLNIAGGERILLRN